MAKKNFWSTDLFRKVPEIFGQALQYIIFKREIFFLHNWGILGIKRRRILRRIKKCKLSSEQNRTKKKLWPKKDFKKENTVTFLTRMTFFVLPS